VAHEGRSSIKLQADFSGGGVYVGTWRDLGPRDFKEIHFWIKAPGIALIGTRIADATGQVHQKDVNLVRTDDWQEFVIKFAEYGEHTHWGGANDGKWHGPAKAFGVCFSKISFARAGTLKGEIWFDDLEGFLNTDSPEK
jgi:hypothetical protein